MKLTAFRKEQNLTRAALADLIGVSGAAITRYEDQGRIPDSRVMKRIMEVTGGKVTPNDFYAESSAA